MFKLAGNIKTYAAIDYAQLTADKTGDDIIDTKGYDDVFILIHIHAVGAGDADNYFTAKIQEGDEPALGDAALIADGTTYPSRYFGESPSDRKIDLVAQADTFLVFGIRPMKRYIRLMLLETSTADATVSAVVILGNPKTAPTV
jgi:hypothetical protein